MQNFKVTADYHTHTFYSDGHDSVEDNVREAVSKGLEVIGITDHGFNHCMGGIKRSDIPKLRAEIERVQAKYTNIKILLGIEANLLNYDGELDIQPSDIDSLDYIIFGVHKFTFGKKVRGSFLFNARNLLWDTVKHKQKITDSYLKALEKYPVKIVVHPNYATACDVGRLARACAEKGVWFELNGKRIDFNAEEVEAIKQSGVDLVLSSDAHHSQNVGDMSLQREFIEKYDLPLEKIVNIKIVK